MKNPFLARRALPSLLAVSVAVALAGCAAPVAASSDVPKEKDTAATSYPLTIDNCGTEVTIDKEPTSILTIGTSALSLLDAAGAADRIVARSGEFGADIPELSVDVSDVPVVDPSDPSTEKIVGANADIVIGYGLFKSTDEDLAASGVANIVIDGECSHDAALTDATDFDAIFADIERLGAIFNTADAAKANVSKLSSELEKLEVDAATGATRSSAVVYYFSPSSTLSARGSQGIANDILKRAGLENIYADEASVYLETNIETLLDADPDVIVLAYGLHGESFDDAKAQFLKEPGANDLSAVKADALVGVPASDLAPDPDALQGLSALLEGVGATNP